MCLGRGRVELPPLSGLDPKSSASTSFAICPGDARPASLTRRPARDHRAAQRAASFSCARGPRVKRNARRTGRLHRTPRLLDQRHRLGLPPLLEEAAGVLELNPRHGHAVDIHHLARRVTASASIGSPSPARSTWHRLSPRASSAAARDRGIWARGGIFASSRRRSEAASASGHGQPPPRGGHDRRRPAPAG